MRTASEKLAIIRLVEESELSVRRTLDEIKVSRTSFYRWYSAYEQGGLDGLENQGRSSRRHWNRIPDSVRSLVVAEALDRPRSDTPGVGLAHHRYPRLLRIGIQCLSHTEGPRSDHQPSVHGNERIRQVPAPDQPGTRAVADGLYLLPGGGLGLVLPVDDPG